MLGCLKPKYCIISFRSIVFARPAHSSDWLYELLFLLMIPLLLGCCVFKGLLNYTLQRKLFIMFSLNLLAAVLCLSLQNVADQVFCPNNSLFCPKKIYLRVYESVTSNPPSTFLLCSNKTIFFKFTV